jgi:glycosyltransferase involved in cell wall biosynthesis
MTKPTRVLFFVTAPQSTNGYSAVGYELAKQLSKRNDINLTIFGFQNFNKVQNHREDFPKNVHVFDAFAHEEPKQAGFGVSLVKDFVTTNRPDICIVYNDMLVLSSVIGQLKEVPNRKFKIIAYIDQVYLCQKKDYINFINQNADVAMLFTPFWEECIKNQGLTIPTCNLPHGFNMMTHYPIPKHIARKFYSLKNDDFIVLNLNRNQPRKRWDICLQAFAELVKKMPDEPIKLLIATAVQGAWNLLEIYERELKKRGLTLQDGMKHVILLDNPQLLSDEDVNFLYNVADIGLNTCDGEGFGLCNFQQAAIGIPQIVPNIGGFREFFDKDTALLVEPKMTYYVDNSRDMVCGEAELCDYHDYANAIETYYKNRDLMKQHGINARKKILEQYPWEKFGDKLYGIIKDVAKELPTINEDEEAEVDDEEEININSLTEMIENVDMQDSSTKPPPQTPRELPDIIPLQPIVPKPKKQEEKRADVDTDSEKSTKHNKKEKPKHNKVVDVKKLAKEKLKDKLKLKSSKEDLETIQELKKKLDMLMAKAS